MDVSRHLDRDLVRASVAAETAWQAVPAAACLFDAVGRRVLPETTRLVVREVVQGGASQLWPGGPRAVLQVGRDVAREAGSACGTELVRSGTQALARRVVVTSAREIARHAGRAALLGGAVDAAFAAAEGVAAVRAGRTTPGAAALHVAREGATGAVASAAGVGAVALLVTVTGPVGWGAAALVGGGAALAAKAGLARVR